jgi:cellulase
MSIILAIAAFAGTALAHGTVSGVLADGKYFPGWKNDYHYSGTIPKDVVGWSSEGLDNGYVGGDRTPIDGPDIICHINAKPAAAAASVKAGGTLDFQWTKWPDSHVGPMITYVAKCDGDSCATADKTALKWAKIEEAGFANNKWAAIDMIANNNTWSVKVPETLAAGSYVFRHETIALHSAKAVGGAQNYPFCLNIDVTGSGTATPDGVLGTALYTASEKGIVWDVYQSDNTQYPIPGPKLWDGAAGSGSGSPTTPNTPTTPVPSDNSTAPVATPTPSEGTSVPPPISTGTPSAPANGTGLAGEFTIDDLEKWLVANTEAGKEYTVADIVAMLQSAGSKVRRHARQFF